VIDGTGPKRLGRFWAAALRYALEPPPVGFGTWDDYWRDVEVPDVDLGIGADRIIIEVSESKTVKNRLHLDIHASGGQAVPIATRRERVDAEARRLTDLGATTIGVLDEEGSTTTRWL
jgi:Glyoxalase-like domain